MINLIEIQKIFIETDLNLENIADYYNQYVYIDESSESSSESEIPYYNDEYNQPYEYLENYYEQENNSKDECKII